jgi:hypothetical protein
VSAETSVNNDEAIAGGRNNPIEEGTPMNDETIAIWASDEREQFEMDVGL